MYLCVVILQIHFILLNWLLDVSQKPVLGNNLNFRHILATSCLISSSRASFGINYDISMYNLDRISSEGVLLLRNK
jgi:hypothetical protein